MCVAWPAWRGVVVYLPSLPPSRDTITANDGGVLNDGRMRAFYAAHVRRLSAAAAQGRGINDAARDELIQAAEAAQEEGPDAAQMTTLPRRFSVLASNVRTHFSGRGGVSILQLTRPQGDGRVDVDLGALESPGAPAAPWSLATVGVRRIRIVLPRPAAAPLSPRAVPPPALVIDGGDPIPVADGLRLLHLCRADGHQTWAICHSSPQRSADASIDVAGEPTAERHLPASEWDFERQQRGPHNTGPARMVAAAPFVIVFGTGAGDPAVEDRLRRGAELLSQGHLAAAHAFAPVVSDADLRLEEERGDAAASAVSRVMSLPCGTNVILVGGPAENAWTARVVAQGLGDVSFDHNASSPMSPFSVGGLRFDAPGTALITVLGWTDPRERCAATAGASGSDGDDAFASTRPSASPARLALVACGTDAEGLFAALRFSAPTIPPSELRILLFGVPACRTPV